MEKYPEQQKVLMGALIDNTTIANFKNRFLCFASWLYHGIYRYFPE